MRKFDPWPVFFKREWNRNWPFLVGFPIIRTLIVKFTAVLQRKMLRSPSSFRRTRGDSKWCEWLPASHFAFSFSVKRGLLVWVSDIVITEERCPAYSLI